MIVFHNVSKSYPPDQEAIRNIDLKITPGDFVFVAGASGAGKTTFLKLVLGSERASSGQVLVLGRNMGTIGQDEVAAMRREIGVVFQDYKLLTRRTVLDNVAFGLEIQGVPLRERQTLSMELLAELGLDSKARSFPETLSGGEQQRVALARALLPEPRLILADEPTGNLDSEMTRVIFDLLLEANASGVTVLVATHNLAIIEELNMRTIVLDRGKILGNFDRARRME